MRLSHTLLLGLLFSLVLVGSADAYLYWANAGTNASGTTLGRANLDGSGANQSFVTGARGPVGVDVDNAHIYWSDAVTPSCSGTTIGRANLNGTGANPSFINGTDCAHEVDVNSTHIYWANRGPNGTGTTIGRANLNGTGVNSAFITGGAGPWGVAINATHIYWTNRGTGSGSPCGGSIGVANLDGTGTIQNFITGVDGPTGIAVDGGHLYWANGCGTSIGRANLNGTGVNQNFITGLSQPAGVEVDGTFIYWANFANPTAGGGGTSLGRANLNGTGVNLNFITGASSPTGVAVDAGAPPPSFGSRVLVKLKLAAKRIRARGPVKVEVSNANTFLVTGTLSGKTAERVSVAQKRRVALDGKAIQVAPGGTKTVKLKLPQVLRDVLKDEGELALRLKARVGDPAGNNRTVKKRVTVKLKG